MNRRTLLKGMGSTPLMSLGGCLEATAKRGETSNGSENEPNGSNESSGPSEEHEKWHLCEDIAREPSLAFESKRTTLGVELADGITSGPSGITGPGRVYVALLTEADDLDHHEITADHIREFSDETAFETQALLAVQYGRASSSNLPRIVQIERTDDEIHAFGCIADPKMPTMDATIVTVMARFEWSDRLETAKATLVTTRGEITVKSDEGVVTIGEEKLRRSNLQRTSH